MKKFIPPLGEAVMEFKVKGPTENAANTLESAAKQVRENQYAASLRASGVELVYEYAMAFDGKKVFVELVDDVLKNAQNKAQRAAGKSKARSKKSTRKR